MEIHESVAIRQQMLAAWVCEWLSRHRSALARERSLVPVRVGRRTYLVTAQEAERALAQTHDELFQAFAVRPQWGVDVVGRPSEVAVRGLAVRRLSDRMRDALRARANRPLAVGLDDADSELAAVAVAPYESVDAVLDLKRSLADESSTTREIVWRCGLNESAAEAAAGMGLQADAVRQRLSRFRRGVEAVAA